MCSGTHMRPVKLSSAVIIILVLMLTSPKCAYAYVDPGTGSFVVQLILGFIFGSIIGIKLYWKKIKSFFAKLFSRKPDA